MRPDQEGSATLELTILAPALLVLLGLAIVAGRIETASAAVEHAAAVGARDASLARTPALARLAAANSVNGSLASQGIACGSLNVNLDAAGFSAPPGTASVVRLTVSCTLALSDVAVPGVPGTRLVKATMTSPLDTYRSR
jgi:Flp pilus assembly protein TadG